MKKILLTVLIVLVAVVSIVAMVGCSGTKVVVMAEAGSAGEDFAKDFVSKVPLTEYVSAQAQRDVLTELIAGTADIGIIDSIMANYYINTEGSTFKGKLDIVDLESEEEAYAIGFRKEDVYLTQKVNEALYQLQEDGTIGQIAATYGLTDALITFPEPNVDESLDKSGYNYVINNGELVVGYTIFAPIAYENADKQLIGFDTDVAKAVCAKLGVTAKFQEIDWNLKETELSSKNIDAIWNGMTKTDERAQAMSLSASYLKNKQVAVVRTGEQDKVN